MTEPESIPKLRIAVTGSTGLVGSCIAAYFLHQKQEVLALVRPGSSKKNFGTPIAWDPAKGTIDSAGLEGVDIIIHLAGASIAGSRWTPKYKKKIRDSRVQSTRFLSEAVCSLKTPPRLLISCSAIGFYGNDPSGQPLEEHAPVGNDFLASVCAEWESATRPVEDAGIRVINMRLGTVLSKQGGALAMMLPPFQCGLGGPLGSGAQMFSWVALEEIPFIIDHMMTEKDLAGPVNVTSPDVRSNTEFSKALGKALHRPSFLPLPAFMVKILFGEMGEALLLGGANVQPLKLQESGYQYRFSNLNQALEHILSK